jgi:SAM-dependent methyltransferase
MNLICLHGLGFNECVDCISGAEKHWQSISDYQMAVASMYQDSTTFENIPKWKEVLNLFKSGTVLDMGCGIGKYFYSLTSKYNKVYAYDFQNMLDLIPDSNKFDNLIISSDLNYIKSIKYDDILISMTFHYWNESFIDDFLNNVSKNGSCLIVHEPYNQYKTNKKALDIISKYYNAELIIDNVPEGFFIGRFMPK